MLRNALFVALGGGLGSALRYLIATGIHKYNPAFYPYGTFAVNIAGCFLIGLLMGAVKAEKLIQPDLQLLLIAGFCGGFTTFSTFAFEGQDLLNQGKIFGVILYTGLSVVVGLTLAYFGYRLSQP